VTNEDKADLRHYLRKSPELSDVVIARKVGCAPRTVRRYRAGIARTEA